MEIQKGRIEEIYHHNSTLRLLSLNLELTGNIADASLIAVVGALRNLTLPQAKYSQETERLTVDMDAKTLVKTHSLPIPLSFTVRIRSLKPSAC